MHSRTSYVPTLFVVIMVVSIITACSLKCHAWGGRKEEVWQTTAGDCPIIKRRAAYPHPTGDYSWSAGYSGVSDIQTAFNNARANENSQLGTSISALTMPSQLEWDVKSDGGKALWLINRERQDRGIAPLHSTASRQM